MTAATHIPGPLVTPRYPWPLQARECIGCRHAWPMGAENTRGLCPACQGLCDAPPAWWLRRGPEQQQQQRRVA